MKNILTIILSLISVYSFAQTETIAIKKEAIKSYPITETSYTFNTPSQVVSGLSAPDTLIIAGDTILTNWPDTVIINFPVNFYDSYNGHTTVNITAISGETALGIAKIIAYGSQCQGCKFTKISEDASAPYDFTVPDIRLQLRIVATSGTGRIQTETTLKSN